MAAKKKVLFIDRDGTLIWEPPVTFQVDNFSQLKFLPGVFTWLGKIARETDFELVMVTNQDGLGTKNYPEETFWPIQNFVVECLEREGIKFSAVHIDKSYPEEKLATRKPGTGMLTHYIKGDYDLAGSFVIGDRLTDVQLAGNLGAKAIFILNNEDSALMSHKISCNAKNWEEVYNFLIPKGTGMPERKTTHTRKTKETDISVELNLDGKGNAEIKTGLGFFDHMLEQIAKHGNVDLRIACAGDLHIDEHHTIEDVAITLGESFAKALGNKMGIERYGFCLPMDDCLAQVAIDFGGRNWLEWKAEFKREKVGDMPTEMFFHFFKSFTDGAKCNLNVQAEGENEHHKIEAIFKAFAKSIKMAVKQDPANMTLPSTKGLL